jgi:uncharacterized membrane protein (UPF0127 family)
MMPIVKTAHPLYAASINGVEIARRVCLADTFRSRTVGLLGRDHLPAGELLWIHAAPSIHTMGMRFAIDVIFLNQAREIVRVVWALPRFRMVFGGYGACSVLEAHTGWLDRSRVIKGATVEFSAVPLS